VAKKKAQRQNIESSGLSSGALNTFFVHLIKDFADKNQHLLVKAVGALGFGV